MINENYLEEGDKLEIFRSRGVIRFTTKAVNKEMIIQIIENSLTGIERENLKLSLMLPTQGRGIQPHRNIALHFDDATLAEAAVVTDTTITRIKDTQSVLTTSPHPLLH